MKKLLILPLLLASCTLLPAVPGLRIEGLSVTVLNPLSVTLEGDPSRPTDGPGLVVEGVNVRPDVTAAAWCRAHPNPPTGLARWACNLPDIPAKQQLRVTFEATGTGAAINEAQGFAYTSLSGAVPVPLVPLR